MRMRITKTVEKEAKYARLDDHTLKLVFKHGRTMYKITLPGGIRHKLFRDFQAEMGMAIKWEDDE